MIRRNLQEWLNIPAVLECKAGQVEGSVRYGIRVPIRSGIKPLLPCPVNDRRGSYWFVSPDQTTKVRIPRILMKISDKRISGVGIDSGIFRYTITKR